MIPYQNFLDFFAMHNKERLDGLNEIHFSGMSTEERQKAFGYLLQLMEAGGSEESMHGLFLADPVLAGSCIERLLAEGRLREEAEIAGAWSVYSIERHVELLAVLFKGMSSANGEVRTKAVYYAAALPFTNDLKAAFEQMIRSETIRLARIHAVNGLLAGMGVSKESVGKKEFRAIYRGLHSEDSVAREAAFERLNAACSPVSWRVTTAAREASPSCILLTKVCAFSPRQSRDAGTAGQPSRRTSLPAAHHKRLSPLRREAEAPCHRSLIRTCRPDRQHRGLHAG